jgi:FdhD protein
MRTPGHDVELAVGFLFGEGIVTVRETVREVRHCPGGGEQRFNVVEVHLAPGAAIDQALPLRNFYMTSSCGVCGKASLDAVERRGCVPLPEDGFHLPADRVACLAEGLSEAQALFARTGGLHAAGLFDGEGALQVAREDVGRHNAVDKVVGAGFLAGDVPLARRVLVVSGRASFEIVQKAVAAGVPLVVAVGAPSSLAVELARRFRLTLVGFAREGRFNVYSGEGRIS